MRNNQHQWQCTILEICFFLPHLKVQKVSAGREELKFFKVWLENI